MLLKRQLLIVTLLVIGALLSATATAMSFMKVGVGTELFPAVEEKYTSFQTAAYIVKEHSGYVAVFSSNPSQLLEITDIPVSTLPTGDRTLLRTGIAAKDRSALLMLLEDLNS